ncbi:MAG: hypothetical protein H7174_04125 [Flavobacterium sp.]|nr:hypothetical protein [Flavobacterium sp.]
MNANFNPNPNSFKKTFCVFQEVNLDCIKNLKVIYESQSGSKYFYNELGMFRLSNHWGRLANSKWRLIHSEITTDSKFKLGFAMYDSFFYDNDVDDIYFLEYNSNDNSINYNHKNNPEFDGKAILRTTYETRKRIKQARNIVNLSSWAKYHITDINVLRLQVLNELIYTNKTLDEIKRSLR